MTCGRGTWGLASRISALWPRSGMTFVFKAQYYPKDQVHLLLPHFVSNFLDSQIAWLRSQSLAPDSFSRTGILVQPCQPAQFVRRICCSLFHPCLSISPAHRSLSGMLLLLDISLKDPRRYVSHRRIVGLWASLINEATCAHMVNGPY